MGLTRKELVLQLLRQHVNEWVDGTRIASAEVGGSEGLKRLRELRQDGFDIRMRKHPDPRRDIFQYRLVVEPGSGGARESYRNETLPRGPVAAPPAPLPISPGVAGREFPLSKNEETGEIEIKWQVCEKCGGRYAIEADHLVGPEHKRWEKAELVGQTEMEVPPQPEIFAYTEKPEGLRFGEAVVCPRCHGIKRHRRKGVIVEDPMCMDPKLKGQVCMRCRGWGVVPNQGPVETAKIPETKPEPVAEAETTEAFTDG